MTTRFSFSVVFVVVDENHSRKYLLLIEFLLDLARVTMQSLCASSSSLVSRALTASRGRGWALFWTTTTLAPTTVALCEDKKHEILQKDSQGNINWGKTVSRIPQGEFWDDVARAAGSNVRRQRRDWSERECEMTVRHVSTTTTESFLFRLDCLTWLMRVFLILSILISTCFHRSKVPLTLGFLRNSPMDSLWDTVRGWPSKRWAELPPVLPVRDSQSIVARCDVDHRWGH